MIAERGIAQKNLDMNKFKKLKIPIPTIEQQNKIIKQIDALNYENKKLEEQILKKIIISQNKLYQVW